MDTRLTRQDTRLDTRMTEMDVRLDTRMTEMAARITRLDTRIAGMENELAKLIETVRNPRLDLRQRQESADFPLASGMDRKRSRSDATADGVLPDPNAPPAAGRTGPLPGDRRSSGHDIRQQ
ncbi:MAG: hypothetical protein LBR80_17205 [Deltaproteobacteria bacterium]|nr:hypothetical protein [Deltaproteobacteria bacterium]